MESGMEMGAPLWAIIVFMLGVAVLLWTVIGMSKGWWLKGLWNIWWLKKLKRLWDDWWLKEIFIVAAVSYIIVIALRD